MCVIIAMVKQTTLWINFMFSLALVQGLARKVPPVANVHLIFFFLPYVL